MQPVPYSGRRSGWTLPRLFSAAAGGAIVVGGYVHYCLYRHGYRSIPKIGVGFLLQVLSSAVVAGALLIGRERAILAKDGRGNADLPERVEERRVPEIAQFVRSQVHAFAESEGVRRDSPLMVLAVVVPCLDRRRQGRHGR